MQVSNLGRTCFFCGDAIASGKERSREHIVPDFLLKRMGIKRDTITGIAQREYAKVKVNSHARCNNEFGSEYENRIRSYLDNLDTLFDDIVATEASTLIDYGPSLTPDRIVSTWLSKIYYGLFYYDLATTTDDGWRDACVGLLSGRNFSLIRESYKHGHGFCLPSTLFAFRSRCTQAFDLRTSVAPSAILLKIDSLVLVLAIGDGFLTKQYLRDESLEALRANIKHQEEANAEFPGYLLAWAEVLALSVCIPKSPNFIVSENRITNMSLSTMVADPGEFYRLDIERLNGARDEVLEHLRLFIPKS